MKLYTLFLLVVALIAIAVATESPQHESAEEEASLPAEYDGLHSDEEEIYYSYEEDSDEKKSDEKKLDEKNSIETMDRAFVGRRPQQNGRRPQQYRPLQNGRRPQFGYRPQMDYFRPHQGGFRRPLQGGFRPYQVWLRPQQYGRLRPQLGMLRPYQGGYRRPLYQGGYRPQQGRFRTQQDDRKSEINHHEIILDDISK